MRTFGEILRDLRKERGLTQEDLSAKVFSNRATLANWETGRAQPAPDNLIKLAEFFGISLDTLLGFRPARKSISELTKTPLLGSIRAGIPVMAEENWDGEVEIPSDWKADFALRVVGDSMSWAGIHEGDIAVLRQATEAQSGQVVAAGVEDSTWSATLKYFIRDNGQAVLRAANPEYTDIPITVKHRIIGNVVGVLKEPTPYQEYKALLTSKTAADVAWSEAIEIATQHGLDGERVAHMIRLFAQVSKQV